MTRAELIDSRAEFTWNFGSEFYVATEMGRNFIWSDPNYQGDNSLIETTLSYAEWIDPQNQGLFGRDKGVHRIRDYCGLGVTVKVILH